MDVTGRAWFFAIVLQISLHDFVVGLLNYCVDSKENLSRLAFDVYDRHTTGTITEADLEGMLIDVWGVNWSVPKCYRWGLRKNSRLPKITSPLMRLPRRVFF